MVRVEADGTVTLLGRGNTCVNTGGEKVFPEEVEGALKSHPDVFEAIGLPDELLGQRVAPCSRGRTRRPTWPRSKSTSGTRSPGTRSRAASG